MHTILDERDKLEITDRIGSISNNLFRVTKTGKSIVAEDSQRYIPKGLRVFGSSEQKTTTGAQLLDINTFTITPTDGLTSVINSDGSITVNGTPSKTFAIVAKKHTKLDVGDYYVSGNNEPLRFQINVVLADGTTKYYNNRAFTVDGTETSFTIAIQTGTDLSPINNLTLYPMLNKGATALPYEPYTGGIPAPNPEYPQPIESVGDDGSVEVGVYGGNLLPYPYTKKSHTTVGVTFEETDGRIMINGSPSSVGCDYYIYGNKEDNGEYIYFPKGVYEMSLMPTNTSFDSTDEFISFRTLESGTLFGVSKIKDTLKQTGLHTYGIFVRAGKTGQTYNNAILHPIMTLTNDLTFTDRFECDNKTIKLNTPNGLPGIPVTDASLATYTDENGQMWCADEVDFERGVYVRRIISKIYDGSNDENWVHQTGTLLGSRYSIQATDFIDSDFSYGSKSMNSNFQLGKSGSTWSVPNVFTITSGRVYASLNGTENLATFRQYLSEHPMTVIGILTKPIETPLSAEELAQYKALTMNYPTTTILNNANAYMEVEYVANTQNHIEQNYLSKSEFETLKTRISSIEKSIL